MTSEWCCAPFTVPKPPPAYQNTIDGWRMVVDFRNLNAETKADSHNLPLIRFGPREAGDSEMRQGATGRRQGGDRKTTGWRQEDDRPAAGKRQGSDRK